VAGDDAGGGRDERIASGAFSGDGALSADASGSGSGSDDGGEADEDGASSSESVSSTTADSAAASTSKVEAQARADGDGATAEPLSLRERLATLLPALREANASLACEGGGGFELLGGEGEHASGQELEGGVEGRRYIEMVGPSPGTGTACS